MQLARVIGTVVATVKNPSLEGRKLLIVQSLNKDLMPQGKPLVAVDAAGAGVANWFSGAAARKPVFPSNAKTRRRIARLSGSLIPISMSLMVSSQ